MADFTKNISNTVNMFGQGPSTKWGQANFPYTMTWGSSKWAQDLSSTPREENSIPIDFIKVVDGSTVITNTVSTETYFSVSLTNTQAVTFEASTERLANNGWDYVFVSDTTDAEQRDFASWSSGTASTVSFVCVAAGSTTWT